MRWNVEGADAKTGQEHVVTIEADTQQEAEQKARDGGLLVSGAYLSTLKSALPPPVPQSKVSSPTLDYNNPSTPSKPTVDKPPPPPQATSAPPRQPTYAALNFWSILLGICGFGYFVL